MEYRRLGKSGLELSALSFGSWVTFGQQINEDVAYACMEAAYQAGVNFLTMPKRIRRARRRSLWET